MSTEYSSELTDVVFVAESLLEGVALVNAGVELLKPEKIYSPLAFLVLAILISSSFKPYISDAIADRSVAEYVEFRPCTASSFILPIMSVAFCKTLSSNSKRCCAVVILV